MRMSRRKDMGQRDSVLIRASDGDGGDNEGSCCKSRKTIHYYYYDS